MTQSTYFIPTANPEFQKAPDPSLTEPRTLVVIVVWAEGERAEHHLTSHTSGLPSKEDHDEYRVSYQCPLEPEVHPMMHPSIRLKPYTGSLQSKYSDGTLSKTVLLLNKSFVKWKPPFSSSEHNCLIRWIASSSERHGPVHQHKHPLPQSGLFLHLHWCGCLLPLFSRQRLHRMETTWPQIHDTTFETARLASPDRFLQTTRSVVHHGPPPQVEPERAFSLCLLLLQ